MRVLMMRLLLSESWRRCNLYRSEPKRAAWHPVEELQTYWHSTRTASALDGPPVCTGSGGPGSVSPLAIHKSQFTVLRYVPWALGFAGAE